MEKTILCLLLFLLVAAVNGASICDGYGCGYVNIQGKALVNSASRDQSANHILESLGNFEVELPFEERDHTRSANQKIVPWPNAIVPFVIWGSNATKEKIHNAFKKIEEKSCVKFQPRDDEARYVLIKEGTGGCWTSSMGYPSSYKKVTINLGSGCRHSKQIKHELYHALGFPHEHSRPDRNDHVTIKWNNIKDGASSQFSINDNFPSVDVPYDLYSIMHYGKHDFAKDHNQLTIVPTPWVNGTIGGSDLSYRDIRKLKLFYNCEM